MKTHQIPPRISGKCKLCKLVSIDPKLWQEVHDKVLKENHSQRAVCKWLNSQLSVINAGLPEGEEPFVEFNVQNFSKHFKLHLGTTEAMTLALRSKALGKQALSISNQGDVDQFSAEDIAVVESYMNDQQEITDYTNLTKMIGTLETYLWKHNEQLQAQAERNDRVNLNQLVTFKDLIESVADLKMKLGKIRNSSVVAGSAVRKAVSLSVVAFINQLVNATQDAMNSLQEVAPEHGRASTEIINRVREDVAVGMKKVIEEIITSVSDEFKIK